jgi:hypothetical protein
MRRRVITSLAVAFALWFMISQPVEAAELVRSSVTVAGGLLSQLANSLTTFFTNLV